MGGAEGFSNNPLPAEKPLTEKIVEKSKETWETVKEKASELGTTVKETMKEKAHNFAVYVNGPPLSDPAHDPTPALKEKAHAFAKYVNGPPLTTKVPAVSSSNVACHDCAKESHLCNKECAVKEINNDIGLDTNIGNSECSTGQCNN